MHAGSLETGTLIGRFTVETLIGAGGMGEVYAARDTQLARRVALKILPASRAAEGDRVERFLREARAASSLNHPAIVTIFDSGSVTLPAGDVVHYLAMELIDGSTLSEFTHGGRNRSKVVEVLAQVAEGLARAHSGGIVHRDLKPDNIMVARGGFAKIVDFGVAKLTEREKVFSAAGDTAPTSILGTTSFMAPEQVEGRPVDQRSDVFSFGCVMYAAYQGKSPFERDSAVKTMNAIVNDAPPQLGEAPPGVGRIARRCLAKDPEERYQSIKDVALDLREHIPSPSEVRSTGMVRRLLAGLAASIVIAFGARFAARAGAANVSSSQRAQAPHMSMMRLTDSGKIASGALSPDGKYVVYAAFEGDNQSLWVRQVATGTDVRMQPPADGFYDDIRISADGNYAFYSIAMRKEPNIVDVYRIPILGGQPRKIVADINPGISIAPDGRRVAFRRFSAITRTHQLFIADVESGAEELILEKKFPEAFGSPSWSPDGQRLTFIYGNQLAKRRPNIVDFDLASRRFTKIPSPQWRGGFGGISWIPDGSGIVLTAAEQRQPPQLWYLPYSEGPARKITADVAYYGGVSFSADSKALVTHRSENSANVWVADVTTGDARPLTTGLGQFFGGNGVVWMPHGEILYSANDADGSLRSRVMNPRTGVSRDLPNPNGWRPELSPDRKRFAYMTATSGVAEIWVCDVDGSNARKVSGEIPVGGSALSWMPDSRSIVFISAGDHQFLYVLDVETAETRQLSARPANSPAVSPDGVYVLCRLRSTEPQPNVPLWRTALVRTDGKGEPRYLDVPRGGGPHIFEWMPDGKSFAFADFVNGVGNVWVQDLKGGEPRQLTRFESGRIGAFDVSDDLRSVVLSKSERVNDLVLIRDFR